MIKQAWLVVINYGEYDCQGESPVKIWLNQEGAVQHAHSGNERLKVIEAHCSNEPIDSDNGAKAMKEFGIPYTGSSGCEFQVWGPIDIEMQE